jgi:hypothetical protein
VKIIPLNEVALIGFACARRWRIEDGQSKLTIIGDAIVATFSFFRQPYNRRLGSAS